MDTRLQNQLKAPSPSAVFPMHRGLFQPRSFTEPEREDGVALHSSHQAPDLQAQLDRAARFGHNFGRVQVQANPPAVIQPQHDIRRSEEQQDEQEADFLTEPIKMMAPSLGQPIQRESFEAEPIQMMPHPSLLTSLVQRESLEVQPIQMMPHLGLRSPVIQREVEEVEPIQRMPQLGLYSPVIQPEVEEVQPIQRMPQWAVIQPQEQEVEQEPIQTKLVVGAAGDKYEQEADSVAAQVMSMNAPSANSGLVQRQGEEEEQDLLVQRSPMADSITPLVQRQSEEQEEAIQTKSLLQRAGAKSNAEVGSGLENKLNGSKGGGSPLPDNVRSFMEPRFGTNFSAVRVHTDSSAVQMNKELGAQAFAHGNDIYYGSGKSPAQDSLTAHELTHVVQQSGGVMQRVQLKPDRELNESEKAKMFLKFDGDRRQDQLKQIVWEGHLAAIAEVCKKHKYTIAIRETGSLSIKRIEQGAKAKPHTILEKSIKESSIKKGGYQDQEAQQILNKLERWDLDGFVGHWDSNHRLIGVRIDKIPKDVKDNLDVYRMEEGNQEPYVKEEGSIAYVPLKLNEDGGGLAIKALQQLQEWKKYLYTGDYDLHEVYSAQGGGSGQIPEATKDKVDLLNRLNQGVSNTDSQRVGKASLSGSPQAIHVKGDYAMFQHGDQATYRMNQHIEAQAIEQKVAKLVRAVATESDEPMAWCRHGEWFVTVNKTEHDILREKFKLKKPHTWSKNEDQKTQGKKTERYI